MDRTHDLLVAQANERRVMLETDHDKVCVLKGVLKGIDAESDPAEALHAVRIAKRILDMTPGDLSVFLSGEK